MYNSYIKKMTIRKIYSLLGRDVFRKKRMKAFLDTFKPTPQTTILDVGGTPYNWNLIGSESRITLVNMYNPEERKDIRNMPSNMAYEVGDGTNLSYPDKAFDICYSNSVIEHLGTYNNQVQFAKEVRRMAERLWVQTPARSFPIELHLITPIVHFLPKRLQRLLLKNFTVWGLITRPSTEKVEGFLEEVRLLNLKEMQELFPDCAIRKEKFMGLTKAYIAVRR